MLAIVHSGAVDWDVTLGAAYQYTRLASGVNEARVSDDFALIAGTELNFDIGPKVDLDNSYRLQLVATDFGKTSHHSESVLSVDIWGPLDLDVSFIWDRIEDPATDDGDTPKANDFRLIVGFGLEF